MWPGHPTPIKDRSPSIPKWPLTNKEAAGKEEHRSAERLFWRRQLTWVKAQTWITGLASIAAIVSLGLVYLGIAESKDATRVANRAWLFPKKFGFGDFTPGQSIRITMETENVGHSPALGPVFTIPEFDFVPLTPEMRENATKLILPVGKGCSGIHSQQGNTIFPGQSYPYERIISNVPRGSMELVRSGDAIFYFRDCAAYRTFGEEHTSSFCFYLNRNIATGEMAVVHCPRGNDAD